MTTIADLYEKRRRRNGEAYIDAVTAKDRVACARIVRLHQAESRYVPGPRRLVKSPSERLTQERIDGVKPATVRTLARTLSQTHGSAPEAEPA